jgi:hypothetical protein
MIHQIKLQKAFFEEKIAGKKPWELRFDDLGYKVGDYLGANEVIEVDGEWRETGRFVLEKIVNIVTADECPGIQKGWVILTTDPCKVIARGQIFADVDTVYPVYGGEKNAE